MFNRITSFLLIPTFFALLGACQTTSEVGTAPIALSSEVMSNFKYYKTFDYPLFFAVSADGKHFNIRTCSSAQCAPGADSRAIKKCEDESRLDCKIFADGHDIVWKGPITYPGGRSNTYSLLINLDDEGNRTFNQTGNAVLSYDKAKFDLKVNIEGSDCTGIANIGTNKWELSCTNPTKWFRGKFHPATNSKFEGTGRGTGGLKVRLLIPN